MTKSSVFLKLKYIYDAKCGIWIQILIKTSKKYPKIKYIQDFIRLSKTLLSLKWILFIIIWYTKLKFKNVFSLFLVQPEEQGYFMSLEEQLCVTCAKMKIAKIYVSQNQVNKKIMLRCPLHLILTSVYICILSFSRFTLCFISMFSVIQIKSNYFTTL